MRLANFEHAFLAQLPAACDFFDYGRTDDPNVAGRRSSAVVVLLLVGVEVLLRLKLFRARHDKEGLRFVA